MSYQRMDERGEVFIWDGITVMASGMFMRVDMYMDYAHARGEICVWIMFNMTASFHDWFDYCVIL